MAAPFTISKNCFQPMSANTSTVQETNVTNMKHRIVFPLEKKSVSWQHGRCWEYSGECERQGKERQTQGGLVHTI